MAEGTHTSEAIYGLGKAVGRGGKLWCGNVTVTRAETLDTGLDTVEGVGLAKLYSATGKSDSYVGICSVSGGTLTMDTGKLTEPGTSVTDVDAYIIVVGAIN